jgi:hypothetical protein
MICHFCQREATGKCVSCGLGFCSDHGKRYCQVCSNAVFSEGTAPAPREGKGYLQCPPRPEMPTIYLDDDGPPECYRCQGLAFKVCQGCHNLFCRDHAGKGGCCEQCTKAARLANWVMAGIVCTAAGLALAYFLLSQSGHFAE